MSTVAQRLQKSAYKCVGLIVGLESEGTLPCYQQTHDDKLVVHHPEPKEPEKQKEAEG
jgi:hypothetical protein